jgi:hypothetical protein
MKQVLYSALVLAVFAVLATSSMFAANNAGATIGATIVAPIAIAKTADMNFGIVGVAGAGTVVLSTEGGRTPNGGAQLYSSQTGTVSAAEFHVTGTGNLAYTIAYDDSAIIVSDGGSGSTHNMSVDTWTCDPGKGDHGVLSSGSEYVRIGATLNINSGQLPGVYTSETGEFVVSVSYN